MLRQGEGEPLVLLHGVTGGEGMWEEVMPLLAPHHDAVALTALGHRGGRQVTERPVQMKHIVDDAERSLDELGFDTAHVVGNSMGGWAALELARRGRARSVCAFSPSGTWEAGAGSDGAARQGLRGVARDARRARPLLPVLLLLPPIRRYALRKNAVHGERMPRKAVLARTDDLLACQVLDDLLDTSEHMAPIDPLPCPITIAWGEQDRVLPLKSNGACARELVPAARFVTFDEVGHVPMFDDPQLVARTILETTR
jgi:pimeloyl-ACP methyl ester carboxylesterase